MRKWMLAAGAAALAIMSPALAEKGGQGGGNKGQSAQKGERGGGHKAHGNSQKQAKSDRGGQRGNKAQFVQRDDKMRGGGQAKVRADNRGPDKVKAVRVDNDGKVRGRGRDDNVKIRGRDFDDDVRVVRIDDDNDLRFAPRWVNRGLRLGFVDGCPPGLAKKGNGCMPPGQFKHQVGSVLAPSIMSRTLAGPMRMWYRDDDDFLYRWDDDYIYRVRRDGGLIDALFPYQNRDFYYYPVGMAYPDSYNFYNVPYQYQSFYPDSGDYLYRYGDGAIYMVDPQTRMIQGIAALLTGNPLAVGQPLPPAYGVYNVPLGFRSTYYDTPDAWYRYNDGYIYRVDPTTQLVTAVIDALV